MNFFHVPPGMEEALLKRKAQQAEDQKTPEQKKEEFMEMARKLPANAIIINGDSMIKVIEDDASLPVLQPFPNDRNGVMIDPVPAKEGEKPE